MDGVAYVNGYSFIHSVFHSFLYPLKVRPSSGIYIIPITFLPCISTRASGCLSFISHIEALLMKSTPAESGINNYFEQLKQRRIKNHISTTNCKTEGVEACVGKGTRDDSIRGSWPNTGSSNSPTPFAFARFFTFTNSDIGYLTIINQSGDSNPFKTPRLYSCVEEAIDATIL